MPYKKRLALADAILPERQSPREEAASVEFRARRSEWARFAVLGSGGALAAILAAASWEGTGLKASLALSTSAYGFVLALILAVVSIALGLWAAFCRTYLIHRREFEDEPPWDQEEATRRYYEQDEHENSAHIWVPAALRWYVSNYGATLALIASVLVFLYSSFDAVHRLQSVLRGPAAEVVRSASRHGPEFSSSSSEPGRLHVPPGASGAAPH